MAQHKDTYAGDREDILDMWPDSEVSKNMHIHAAYDGGYYNHTHDGGTVSHVHIIDSAEECDV